MALDELMAEVGALMPGAEIVQDLTNSGRATLARIAVEGTTYVAKRNHDEARFSNEVTALRTLPAEVRPALIAAGERVVVMEDLGAGDSLADVLLGDDPQRATDTLLLWARTLAAALKPSLREGARESRLDLCDAVENFVLLGKDLGIPGADLNDEMRAIEDELSATSPWFAFGPSDACPDNNRLMPDGTMKFFDFEGAGWRHAASEAAYTRAPFCTCWCVGGLPDGMTAATENAFIDTLAPRDPDAFRAGIDAATIGFMLQFAAGFRWQVDTNAPLAPKGITPPTHGRQYAHGRLTLMAGYADRYPRIAALAEKIAATMRERWPDCAPLPMYPAFR